MKRIWIIFRASILTITRDPMALLFGVVFPVVLFFFFVNIFASPPSSFSADLYIYTPASSQLLQQVIDEAGKTSEAGKEGHVWLHLLPPEVQAESALDFVQRDALAKRRTPALFHLPEQWEAQLERGEPFTVSLYAQANDPGAYQAASILTAELLRAAGKLPTGSPIAIEAQPITPSGGSGVDRTTLNILLLTALITGGTQVVAQYAYLTTSGMKKKLLASPLQKHELLIELLAEAIVLIYVISFLLVLISTIYYRGTFLQSPLDVLLLAGSLAIVTIFSASLGLVLTALIKEPDYAVSAVLPIYLALMFLSGLAIPMIFFPDLLRQIAEFLPTRQIALALENSLFYGQHDLRLYGLSSLAAAGMFVLVWLVLPWRVIRR